MKQARDKSQSGNTHLQRRKTMNHRFTTHLTALAAVALLLFGASQALAGGTPSNTLITNSATLDYTVNLIPQDQKDSDTVTFKVDKKVDLTVTTDDSALVEVTPGTTNLVLTFTVANTGNDTQDIRLTALAKADATADPFANETLTDNFDDDDSNISIFVETNGTAGYQSADVDTYIDELAADDTIVVYIVRDIESTRVDEDMAVYALVAQVGAGGVADTEGTALSQTALLDVTDSGVDILFADANGTDDAANDGKYSDRSGFLVVSADMTADKSQTIVGGYAVPGASITYSILVSNDGAADATSVIIIDDIPGNTTYEEFTTCSGTKAWFEDTDADTVGDTWQTAEPATLANIKSVRCTIATITADNDSTVAFKVEIN
jgi:uncharacterized repeat protein (TIGR01451 family)